MAEMSAQVMLDQQDGGTETSPLNNSQAAANLLSPGLSATQRLHYQQPNIITINSVGKTDLNDRDSDLGVDDGAEDSQLANFDL